MSPSWALLVAQPRHATLLNYKPDSRLPVLSTRPTVTFIPAKHHRLLASTKLYCLLLIHAHEHMVCEQLGQCCYMKVDRPDDQPLNQGWSQRTRKWSKKLKTDSDKIDDDHNVDKLLLNVFFLEFILTQSFTNLLIYLLTGWMTDWLTDWLAYL